MEITLQDYLDQRSHIGEQLVKLNSLKEYIMELREKRKVTKTALLNRYTYRQDWVNIVSKYFEYEYDYTLIFQPKYRKNPRNLRHIWIGYSKVRPKEFDGKIIKSRSRDPAWYIFYDGQFYRRTHDRQNVYNCSLPHLGEILINWEKFHREIATRRIQRAFRRFMERPTYPSGRKGFQAKKTWQDLANELEKV